MSQKRRSSKVRGSGFALGYDLFRMNRCLNESVSYRYPHHHKAGNLKDESSDVSDTNFTLS